uniref:Major facilitator superfamily (MFS) profile domain-containing protein n=1 Tax=Fusarium oxysporum (strain Fo5176) TaxID=660025 RepID=A0A0D2Y1I9_FUSOF
MPSMVVPPSWFGRHRALCMGIISSGTGVGGLFSFVYQAVL